MWNNSVMDKTPESAKTDQHVWDRVGAITRKRRFTDYPGARQATFAASCLNWFAWILVAGCGIGGLLLLTYTDPAARSYHSFGERHPFVWHGITLVLGGFLQMMVVVMISNFVKATVSFQSEVGAFFGAFKEAAVSVSDPHRWGGDPLDA